MRKNFILKWFGFALMTLALTVSGVACGSDNDTGADVSATIDSLPPADLDQGNVEDAVTLILDQISPMGMMGMMFGGDGFGGIPSFAPPRPQATIEYGCMTITYPDDIMATSGTVRIELNNCSEATDGISGDGVMEFSFSLSGNNYNVNGSIDITDGDDFIDMEFSSSSNMTSEEEGTVTATIAGSISNPDNPGEIVYMNVDQTLTVSGGVYEVDMSGDFGSSEEGRVTVTGENIMYSDEECYGYYPYSGTITVSNGTDNAVVTIRDDPCGTADLTINGTDAGRIDLD